MIIGLRVSDKENDKIHPYGYGKAEYIVSIVIYLFLFCIGIYIIFNGIITIVGHRIITPCLSAAWGAIFSIAINELMFRHTICAGTQINSPAMKAKAWESRSDVYSSLAVLIGILGAKMGFHFMDPLAAIIVGIIILKICVEMLKDAILNLLDKSFDEEYIDDIEKSLGNNRAISGVKKIIAREVGPVLQFEIDLYVPPDTPVTTGQKLKDQVNLTVTDIVDRASTVSVRLFATQGDS